MTSTIWTFSFNYDSPVQQTRVTVGHLKIFFSIKINSGHQGFVKIIEIVISLTFSRKYPIESKFSFTLMNLTK